MSRQDWSNTVRRCRSCGHDVTLASDGSFPKHYGRMPSGRRHLCLASGANALTIDELHRRGPGPVPVFEPSGYREYESTDGIFRLIQLDGGSTQAWNVEWTTEFTCRLDDDPDGSVYDLPGYPVDGARTKDEALAFFRSWWAEEGEAFKARWAA